MLINIIQFPSNSRTIVGRADQFNTSHLFPTQLQNKGHNQSLNIHISYERILLLLLYAFQLYLCIFSCVCVWNTRCNAFASSPGLVHCLIRLTWDTVRVVSTVAISVRTERDRELSRPWLGQFAYILVGMCL